MQVKVRDAQKFVLKVFASKAEDFALAGGIALELYYLHHRFSADLVFFSPKYNLGEIDKIVEALEQKTHKRIKLEAEFVAASKAKVRFYTLPLKSSERPLKLDFVEDVFFENPKIQKINGVRVYRIEDLYMQKIIAISGAQLQVDEFGREIMEGRKEARDVFDVYMLSKKIQPLHIFLEKVHSRFQKGIIHWYRTFSRQELKLALMDLDIYDKEFDAKEMIVYLEHEIKQFIKEVIGE